MQIRWQRPVNTRQFSLYIYIYINHYCHFIWCLGYKQHFHANIPDTKNPCTHSLIRALISYHICFTWVVISYICSLAKPMLKVCHGRLHHPGPCLDITTIYIETPPLVPLASATETFMPHSFGNWYCMKTVTVIWHLERKQRLWRHSSCSEFWKQFAPYILLFSYLVV